MSADAAVRAVGLDLGSTRFKAGLLDARGRLLDVLSVPAPSLTGDGDRCEGDATAYASAATELLRRAASGRAAGTPLCITSQRSSFVLWDRRTNEPSTPLISWQDRRAADWCERHRKLETEVFERSGLVLSAHYAGPKLAAMQEHDCSLAGRLRSERTLFGNLETYLIWHWSAGRLHETDATMAARTSMLDLRTRDWSPELLEIFGVPRSVLPRVRPTSGVSLPLECGLTLRATVADQAAGALTVLAENTDAALINLGTGGFVLRPCSCAERRRGYLTGLIHAGDDARCALEGTINGAGIAVDRFGDGPTSLPVDDPSPGAFCLPDAAGLGSPFWRPDVGWTLSPDAERLSIADARRVACEGLVFRIRQVLEGLAGITPRHLFLSGGLAREPFIARALASLLEERIDVLDLREAGLTGAGRLALGIAPFAAPSTTPVEPTDRGSYLATKYPRWSRWMKSLL